MLKCQSLLPAQGDGGIRKGGFTNLEDKKAAIIGSPFLTAFIFALKSWKEDPDGAQVVLGENQEMLTFADANEAHRWAKAHLPATKWGILKVKLHLTW
jgi:hypothetical protein